MERSNQVGAMDIVANLLSLVAEDRVRRTHNGAFHQIRQESVKLSPRVVRSSQTPPAKTCSPHAEVPAIFLNKGICGYLGRSEETMQRSVDRHGFRDAVHI